ncbi:MAG: hypothetical protein DIZ80_00695 [endosymbiont of Galathealinum brachiosum]|uniref:Uncharacterized protein n=1 Tax=endosymbiont of Galathealinum brachiosum TaxID=2200906 RepID=A0A370DM82_9GAMM|nr:MAG: hypothetical protein DIZ80_00695 [endosymbiont of Galathealinum brachiosum]
MKFEFFCCFAGAPSGAHLLSTLIDIYSAPEGAPTSLRHVSCALHFQLKNKKDCGIKFLKISS